MSSSPALYAIIAVVVVLVLGVGFFVWKRTHRSIPDGLPTVAPPHRPQRPLSPLDTATAGFQKHTTPAHVQAPFRDRPPSQQSQTNNYSYVPTQSLSQSQSSQSQPVAPVPAPVQNNEPPRGNLAPSGNLNDDPNVPRPKGNKDRAQQIATQIMSEFRTDATLGRKVLPYSALYFTRVLNKGAFGEVWLAQYENLQVAVKRILNEKKYDEKEIECFGAEIKLMARFDHPKIVQFIGVAWSDTMDICAVTEYMAKSDLFCFLNRKGAQLNWRDHKIYLAEDAADALSYLHSLSPKVIHRDLKSKNILLDGEFRAKLSDFGISRERSLEETMTAGVGTIYWTAPEVLMGKKYTEKADIYSFGIVMSELDTHEVPYSDLRDEGGKKLHNMKVVQMVLRKNLRPTFTSNCPYPVKELAMRCLNADPDQRPDAVELLRRIQSVQDEL